MKTLDIFNLLLVLGILIQLYQPSSQLIPLLAAEDSPRTLHQPDAAQYSLHQQIKQVGSYVNVEDLIRYLEENPKQFDNGNLKKHIQMMQETQQELFHTEEKILATEATLNQIAIALYQALSPSQQRQLNNQRNLDSVQAVEKGYWDHLIENLK